MNFRITTGAFLLTAALLLFHRDLFSWGLFNIFKTGNFSNEEAGSAEEFDPDRDILYLPSPAGKEFFESINDLSICRNHEVRHFINLYLTIGRNFTKKSIERSYIYRDWINGVFTNHSDIPKDLALLPLLESGFSPSAVSRTGATGLWQLMKPTSDRLELKVNRWADERRGTEKSTSAAIRHLKNLYGIFGSWELALAAYNGGGSHVKKAIIESGKNNFWELSESGLLRDETAEFVPRFAALLLIYKNQQLFGISDEITVPAEIPSDTLTLSYPVRIDDIIRLGGASANEIKFFNPELRAESGYTPPGSGDYILRLRPESIGRLRENIGRLYRYRFSGLKQHTVSEGESVSRIAARHKRKICLIIEFNNLKKPYIIRPGDILYIPM